MLDTLFNLACHVTSNDKNNLKLPQPQVNHHSNTKR